MCVYSMIADHYRDRWRERKEYQYPPATTEQFPYQPKVIPFTIQPTITPEEIEEFRKLLERAREYDKRNNEPDCENQEKLDEIIRLAEEAGVGDEVREAIESTLD